MATNKNYEKDYYFERLEEMADAMLASVENAQTVLAQQNKLIAIIEDSDDRDDFDELLTSMKKQNEDIMSQIDILNTRLDYFREYRLEYYNVEDSDVTLYRLVKFLGLFDSMT